MNLLRRFGPWIAYPVAAAVLGWRVGALVAFPVCLVALTVDGPAAVGDTMRMSALVLFSGLAALAVVDPGSGIHRFVPALIPGALAVGAGLSIVVGEPFTVAFARRVAPPEYWDTPIFKHINVVLTAVWAASFAASAAIIAIVLAGAPQAVGVLIGVQVAAFVVPMRISRMYPARARDRYLAANGLAA